MEISPFRLTMFFIFLASLFATVLAGSECPPRQNIYPCSCLALPQGKKNFFTSVTCHRLQDTDSLTSIFPSLRTITIDQFYIYDSFWHADKQLGGDENKQVLPADWLTFLKVKEFEIVDTTLSSCFACNSKVPCKNSITTRFSAVNSSSHEKICTFCKSSTGTSKFPWTGCTTKLRQFQFQHGKLTTITADLFPLPMEQLIEVDLSYNQITKVEKDTFAKTPRLKILNLSHNALESLDAMFTNLKLNALEKLDVSWNLLKSLGNNFSLSIPSLKNLIADNNNIVNLKESDFKNFGEKLRVINLKENPIHCDCSILWVNDTFAVHVAIEGTCVTPEDYENSLIRTASRIMSDRCDENGNLGTRKNTKKPRATTPSF